jgi:hypothetical protein
MHTDGYSREELSIAQRRVHFLRVMRKYNPDTLLTEMATGLKVTETELEMYLTGGVEMPEEIHNRIGPWMLRRCVESMPAERRLRPEEFGFLLNHFVSASAKKQGVEMPEPGVLH